MAQTNLSLFYKEPDPDRWIPGDRYLRKIIRRIYRGRPRIGGQGMVYRNLCKGLKLLGKSYTDNDFSRINEVNLIQCVIGKEHILDRFSSSVPILYGASIGAHPLSRPTLLSNWNIRRILVPGKWMKEMCVPYWGDLVYSWPVGIDQYYWKPLSSSNFVASLGKSASPHILVYDKIRWPTDDISVHFVASILDSIGVSFSVIRYGNYGRSQFLHSLQSSDGMIFLCEHETQGLAYQEALSCNIPVLAWDRQGYWQDPEYYPSRCRFGPVTSVPYWDERCGDCFHDKYEFQSALRTFLEKIKTSWYSPRSFILENLTLELSAYQYLRHYEEICQSTFV